jgi:hypothetical protein
MEVVADYAIADDLGPVRRSIESAEITFNGDEATIAGTVGPAPSYMTWDGTRWLVLDGASAE